MVYPYARWENASKDASVCVCTFSQTHNVERIRRISQLDLRVKTQTDTTMLWQITCNDHVFASLLRFFGTTFPYLETGFCTLFDNVIRLVVVVMLGMSM